VPSAEALGFQAQNPGVEYLEMTEFMQINALAAEI